MKFFARAAWLAGATLFGCMAAHWTRSDQLPLKIHWIWIYGLFAHVLVLTVWTWAWALFWRDGLRKLGGRRFCWAIALAAAAAAELVQKFLPGHFPDWIGFFYNLSGVGIGFYLSARTVRSAETRRLDPQNSAPAEPANQS